MQDMEQVLTSAFGFDYQMAGSHSLVAAARASCLLTTLVQGTALQCPGGVD